MNETDAVFQWFQQSGINGRTRQSYKIHDETHGEVDLEVSWCSEDREYAACAKRKGASDVRKLRGNSDPTIENALDNPYVHWYHLDPDSIDLK